MNTQSKLSKEIIQKIKQSSFDIYDTITKKEQQDYFTVLSSFALVDMNQREPNIEVVALGTGTKSVQAQELFKNPEIQRVHQCHAEVIARRSLRNYLLIQANQFLEEQNSILEEHNGSLRIKPQYLLVFYTSQPPCGQCTIAKNSKVYGITGAKPIDSQTDSLDQRSLRHPPVSSRVNDKNQLTPSFCCSDKIMFWNVLGIQGSTLSLFLSPIYIDAMIVDVRDEEIKSSVRLGVNIRKRLRKDLSKSLFTIKNKIISSSFHLNKMRFIFRSKNHFNQSKYNPSNDQLNRRMRIQESIDQNYQSYSYIYPPVEKINSSNGLKWGIAKKDMLNKKALSQISKSSYFQTLKQVLLKHQNNALLSKGSEYLKNIFNTDYENANYYELKQCSFKYMAIKMNIKRKFIFWTQDKKICDQFK